MQDGGDGRPVYEHLLVARRRGLPVPDLAVPPLPPEAEYLMSAFANLSGQRQVGMSGAQRITVEAMHAWAVMYGRPWTPWEVETLCAMDAALLRGVRKE